MKIAEYHKYADFIYTNCSVCRFFKKCPYEPLHRGDCRFPLYYDLPAILQNLPLSGEIEMMAVCECGDELYERYNLDELVIMEPLTSKQCHKCGATSYSIEEVRYCVKCGEQL